MNTLLGILFIIFIIALILKFKKKAGQTKTEHTDAQKINDFSNEVIKKDDRPAQLDLVAIREAFNSHGRNKSKKDRKRKRHHVDHSGSGPMDMIEFTYRKSNSWEYLKRTVSVEAVDQNYLYGFCHVRKEHRTFSLDRIRGNILSLETGEIRRVKKWAADMRQDPKNGVIPSFLPSHGKQSLPRDWQIAVFFAGFAEEKKYELELLAESAGWQTRQRITPTVNVVVVGGRAGDVQIKTAEKMGIEIINENEFLGRI